MTSSIFHRPLQTEAKGSWTVGRQLRMLTGLFWLAVFMTASKMERSTERLLLCIHSERRHCSFKSSRSLVTIMQNRHADEVSPSNIISQSFYCVCKSAVILGCTKLPGTVRHGTVRYGILTDHVIAELWYSVSSRPAPPCRIIGFGLRQANLPPFPQPSSALATQRSPPSPTHHSTRQPQLPTSSHGATAGATKRYTPPTHREPVSSHVFVFILPDKGLCFFPCPCSWSS